MSSWLAAGYVFFQHGVSFSREIVAGKLLEMFEIWTGHGLRNALEAPIVTMDTLYRLFAARKANAVSRGKH